MVVLHFQAIRLPCLLGCLLTRSARPSCTEQSCDCPRNGLSLCPHLSHPQFAGAGTRTSAFGEQGTDLSPSLLICLGLFPALAPRSCVAASFKRLCWAKPVRCILLSYIAIAISGSAETHFSAADELEVDLAVHSDGEGCARPCS